MLLGLARIDAYHGAPSADAPLVAQWLSLTDGWAGRFLRRSKGRSLVYFEPHGGPDLFRAILHGDWDWRLREIRDSCDWAPDRIIRGPHEFDGPVIPSWRLWSDMDPGLFKDGWRHMAGFLGPMFWCGTSVWKRWAPYFPGADVVSHVGFTHYQRKEPLKPYPEALARPIAEAQRLAPGVPVLIGELGTAAGLPRRAASLRTLADVEGLGGWCYFDVATGADDWRFTPTMDRVFAGMVAA